jgi:hypothetical protein
MSGSLPEMGDWNAVFDETYLQTYVPFLREERTREEALGAALLAGIERGSEVLDCPVGVARHAVVLTDAGYLVTGIDRSEAQLAEAERRRGDAEWPRFYAVITVSCPSPMQASMPCSTCSRRSATSSGTTTSVCSESSAACCGRALR